MSLVRTSFTNKDRVMDFTYEEKQEVLTHAVAYGISIQEAAREIYPPQQAENIAFEITLEIEWDNYVSYMTGVNNA